MIGVACFEPKPHIRKLDSGSWGYFSDKWDIWPRYAANDIRSITTWVQGVEPLPHWMRRHPLVLD